MRGDPNWKQDALKRFLAESRYAMIRVCFGEEGREKSYVSE